QLRLDRLPDDGWFPHAYEKLLPQAREAPCLVAIEPNFGDWRDAAGGRCFWVGNEEINLYILATAPRVLRLQTKFHLGHAIPECPQRHLLLTMPDGTRQEKDVTAGPAHLDIRLHRGLNRFTLCCPDKVTNAALPPETARLFLLGFMDFRLSFAPEEADGV